MSEKVTDVKKGNKWKVLIGLAAVLTILYAGFAVLTTLIVYPSEAHRESYRQMQEVPYTLTEGKSLQSSMEKLDALSEKPAAKYSERVGWIMNVASLILSIAAIGFVYNYLRKNHISTNAALSTSFVEATAATVATLAQIPMSMLYLRHSPSIAMAAVTLIVTFIFSLAFSYLVARIFQWRYDRKHSFVVE